MSKLHDLIDSCEKGYIEAFPGSLEIAVYVEDLVPIMEEYAEYYAKRCLEIAANNAVALERDYNDDWYVDTNSILNIELPSHD